MIDWNGKEIVVDLPEAESILSALRNYTDKNDDVDIELQMIADYLQDAIEEAEK